MSQDFGVLYANKLVFSDEYAINCLMIQRNSTGDNSALFQRIVIYLSVFLFILSVYI